MQRLRKSHRRICTSSPNPARQAQQRRALASAIELMESRLLFHGDPHADIQVNDINTAGGGSVVVNVTYTDDDKVARTSVGASDLIVTNQATGDALSLENVVAFPLTSDSPVVATYTYAAPGGSWDAGDNGSYRVFLDEDRVFDQDGNSVPPTSKTFNVNIPSGGGDDGHGPDVNFKTVDDVHSAGATLRGLRDRVHRRRRRRFYDC